MSSQKKKRNTNDSNVADNETTKLTQDMPLAKAILNNDSATVGSVIAASLPNPEGVDVQDVIISKSLGEAFTGGRSTPVYHIACTVVRNGTNKDNGKRRQRHFVAKLIIMPSTCGGESSSISDRLWIKRESYAIERRFYDTIAPPLRSHLPIPKLLYSDHDGSRPWPAICFLMNDVSRGGGFPNHPAFLSVGEIKRAIRWIANFHALFWGEQQSWKNHMWSRGGFWTPKTKKHVGDPVVKVTGIAQQWTQTIRWMESKHPSAISQQTLGIGKRLEAAAGPISNFLTLQSSNVKQGTLIHGDFKAANLFLASLENCDDASSEADTVVVLDFQFSGTGLGAEDVAYILFPDALGHYFDKEKEILECYHEELISQLIVHQKGGPSTLSFETFRSYYELARVDFTRYLLGKGWVASNEGDARLVSALEDTLCRLDGGRVLSCVNDYMEAISSFVHNC